MSDIPSDMTPQDYVRIINRDRFVKEQLAGRVAALVRENLELMSIIQELQQDLADVRESEAMLFAANTANGEVTVPTPPEGVLS